MRLLIYEVMASIGAIVHQTSREILVVLREALKLRTPYSFVGLAIAMVHPAKAVIFRFNSSTQWIHKTVLPYCPEQALMGTCSSSAKIWEYAVTWRRCLNGSTIPVQGPTPRCKVSCHGTERTCIIGSSMLRRGQSDSHVTKRTDS